MIRVFCNLKYLDITQGAFAVIISAVTLAEGIYLVRKRTDGAKLLPAFLAAFGTRKKLSEQEVVELKKLIDGMRG